MIEGLLAWAFLIYGLVSGRDMCFIASALFAVAANIYHMNEGK